ncbi:MAG: hypothetical protein P8O16_09325 [Algoriphagus sp.]|uniref:hypothetical protein n=1 Tax=Algoriphagus sp. TaxID=1872435 RepID=UPI002618ABD8|nr:hypothetical protein [Algoriphagus sp.]MDG1277469.1 hypothetical protein [Algoriphagus sp.]
MIKSNIVLVIIFILVSGSIRAQTPSYSIEVSAVVVENLRLITVRDLDLYSPSVQGSVIIVNPITSTYAGLFKIQGSPNRTIRINYTPRESIIEQNEGLGVVQALYSMSAAGEDIQSGSFLLTQGSADVTIGALGEVFIWLGAEFDISQAAQGNYLSQFVLEFEYI